MTAIGDLLRLAAALHTWDAVLRSHLIERMKQNCGSAWEAGILRSLHEDRQLEYHQYGDRRPDLRHYLEIREFYWIARGNRRYFGEFTNRDLSRLKDAARVRNEFAHFYTNPPARGSGRAPDPPSRPSRAEGGRAPGGADRRARRPDRRGAR